MSLGVRKKIGCLGLALCLLGQSSLPVFAGQSLSPVLGDDMAGISSLLGDFMESSDTGEEELREFVLAKSTSNDIS